MPHQFKYNPRYSMVRKKTDAVLHFEYPSVVDSPKFKRMAASSREKQRPKHAKSQSQVVFQVKPTEAPKHNMDIVHQFTTVSNNPLSGR